MWCIRGISVIIRADSLWSTFISSLKEAGKGQHQRVEYMSEARLMIGPRETPVLMLQREKPVLMLHNISFCYQKPNLFTSVFFFPSALSPAFMNKTHTLARASNGQWQALTDSMLLQSPLSLHRLFVNCSTGWLLCQFTLLWHDRGDEQKEQWKIRRDCVCVLASEHH